MWSEIGMFEREVALYKALQPYLGGVSFVTYGDRNDLKYKETLRGIQILCNRWGFPNRFYCWLLMNFYPLFWKKATIVKSNQIQGADIALKAARRAGKKFIARCGYLYSYVIEQKYGENSHQAFNAHFLEQNIFSEADQIVVTTFFIRQIIIERYKIKSEKIIVIPNYVLTDLFYPDQKRGDSRNRICFVGRLDKEKNLFALLKAVKGLNLELVIVGSGPLRKELEEKAHKNGISVQFWGNIPHRQLPQILNSSDLFILPSLYEGHPKALLEAMACGLPVIGTDVPGIRELITHRETGYLSGTSPEEIREAIKEVLADRPLRERMGRNAREFIVENFSLERILRMELELLQELVEGDSS